MRKIFRMRYESCYGQCYEYSDVMRVHTLGLDEDGAVAFLKRLLAVHAPSCGNAALGFRLDHDGELDVFVASFERYGALDLFADRTARGAMEKLMDAALAYYASDEYREKVRERPGVGRDACHHGVDAKLLDFAVAFSGLPPDAQASLRARF